MAKKSKKVSQTSSNKKIALVIIFILLLIGGYFGYKGYLLISSKNSVSDEKHILTDIFEINVNREYSNVDAEGIFMRLPEEFVYNKEESHEYDTYRYYKNYVTTDDCDAWISFSESDLSIENILEANKNEVRIMEKYVGNEFELFQYYIAHKEDDISIFTSVDKIRLYYLSRNYFDKLVHDKTNYELTGDLQGVLNVGDNAFNAYLFDTERNKVFVITFWNSNKEYFNYGNVMDILETIYFG